MGLVIPEGSKSSRFTGTASRQYAVDGAAATTTAGSSSFAVGEKGCLYALLLSVASTGGTITVGDRSGAAYPGIAPIPIASGQGCPLPIPFGNEKGVELTNGLSFICGNTAVDFTAFYDHAS